MRRHSVTLAAIAIFVSACGGRSGPTTKSDNGDTDVGGNGDQVLGAFCGDIQVDFPEVCDGANLNGRTCFSQGFASGTLACAPDCMSFDTSGCVDAMCGDGMVTGMEVCDGTNLNLTQCTDLMFASGTLACAGDCLSFDTTGCVPASCNNDTIEGTEVCDGTDLGGQNCALQGRGGGTLGCNPDCMGFDYSGCTDMPAECDNGTIDAGEVCDGMNLGGATCDALGLGTGSPDGGTLGCAADCQTFDTMGCDISVSDTCTGPAGYRDGGINTMIADGLPCNFDSDCMGGECNGSFYCGDDATVPSVTPGQLQLGDACDVNGSCASGYCWSGGDSWVCAQPCVTPGMVMPGGGLVCQGIEAGVPAPMTGAACIPSPGTGVVGDPCDSGVFDCETSLCWDEDYCTDICDPTDASACPMGSSCEFLFSGFFGDTYICVPTTEIGASGEGDACNAPFDCAMGLTCLDEICVRDCPMGNECAMGTYCADDHPAGPVCLDDTTQVDRGMPCERDSQCRTMGDVCFDHDMGMGPVCTETCPTGTCTTMGTTCQQSETGPSMDTRLFLFDDMGVEVDSNDDRGGSLFSLIEFDAPGAGTYTALVDRYPGSSTGPYELEIFVTGDPSTNRLPESEPNDDPMMPQVIASIPATVLADFVDTMGTDDLDHYQVTLGSAGTLTLSTTRARSSVCVEPLAVDGDPCTDDAVCENQCFPFNRSSGDSFCVSECTSNMDCGGGVCSAFIDTNPAARFCFPAGQVGLGDKDFGEECAGPHECTSRMCVRHKYGTQWQCGAPCSVVDQGCQTDGVCSGSNPIYGAACTPHLGFSVAPGGDCVWNQDCEAGNECVAEKCQPVVFASRYEVMPTLVDGAPCNIDGDCTSGFCEPNLNVGGLFCGPEGGYAGCVGGMGNDTLEMGELCDGTDLGGVTCAALGYGDGINDAMDDGGLLGCDPDCGAWDTSGCESLLDDGAPCNSDAECDTGACFNGGNTWWCVSTCTGPMDMSCTGTVFDGLSLNCLDDGSGAGTFACLPNPGQGGSPEPCRSGYLDCADGRCFDGAFCLDECSLADPTCGRDASCVNFAVDRTTDTEIAVTDAAGTMVLEGPNDDNLIDVGNGPEILNLWSTARYTAAGAETVLVRVESSSVIATPASGDYTLQCWTDQNPPAFDGVILESELRAPPVANDLPGEAQDLSALLPQEVAGNLAPGMVTDTDFYSVDLQAGETLTAQTTFPKDQVCWPDNRLGKLGQEECQFSFECSSGTCFGGICLDECSEGGSCAVGLTCEAPFASNRSWCFRSLGFNETCAPFHPGATPQPVFTQPAVCPNQLCLPPELGIATSPFCSDACLTDAPGTGCGPNEGMGFPGECWFFDAGMAFQGFVCLPHLSGVVAQGDACLLDADCATNCCEQATGRCGPTNSTDCHRDQ